MIKMKNTENKPQITSFSNNHFHHNGRDYPLCQDGIEDLTECLWEPTTTYEEDVQNLLNHRQEFTEKAYWQLLKQLAQLISQDTDDD